MSMVLGIGIMKLFRKLLFVLFFYIKRLPSIFFIAILVTMRLLSTLHVFQLNYSLGHWISLVHMNKSVMFKMSLICLELILMRNFMLNLKK